MGGGEEQDSCKTAFKYGSALAGRLQLRVDMCGGSSQEKGPLRALLHSSLQFNVQADTRGNEKAQALAIDQENRMPVCCCGC